MITGNTQVAAVVGYPISHSRSPQIHNAAFKANGLDWVFLALPVAAGCGAQAVEAMRALGIRGLSVTMPHKQAVAAAVDRQTTAVQVLGAANCVFRDGKQLVGDNTDGEGFVRALKATAGVTVADANIAVVGAGGAGRAIVHALANAGAGRVAVINRTNAAAVDAASLHQRVVVGAQPDIAGADIIINATSVGMRGGNAPDQLPFPAELISSGQIVADIVYTPERTRLLAAGAERGATTIDGLAMLVHQAAVAFEHWTGTSAPVALMGEAVRAS